MFAVHRAPGNPRRTTLADVALAAGVSQSTVSRALSDSPLVNEDTRRRVWEVAGRLRFRPNHVASSLRRGATLTVGLVVPDVGNAFFARALKAAHVALKVGGYHVLVIDSDRSADGERAALDTMRAHQVDGLIVATSGGYEDAGVPVVFFDTVPPGDRVCAVAMDNAGGVGQLVEHLALVHGHERIGFIGSVDSVGRERLEGFRAALARVGLPEAPERVRLVDLREAEDAARGAARELLGLAEPPTALGGERGRDRGRDAARPARRAPPGAGGRRRGLVRRAGAGGPARPPGDLARPPRRGARAPLGRAAAGRAGHRGARRPGRAPGGDGAAAAPLVRLRRPGVVDSPRVPAFKAAYLIHGDDHGRLAERRARLRAMAEEASGAGGVEVIEGDACTPDAVVAALSAMTFALGRRFVIADGVERWKEGDVAVVARAMEGADPDALTVAFFAREEARNKAPAALRAAVEAAGGVVAEESAVRPRELPRWLVARAGELGVELDNAGARALVAQVGDRQQRLLRELEKLALEHGEGARLGVEEVRPPPRARPSGACGRWPTRSWPATSARPRVRWWTCARRASGCPGCCSAWCAGCATRSPSPRRWPRASRPRTSSGRCACRPSRPTA